MPRSSSVASQLSTASGVAGRSLHKTTMMNVGKLHVRLTNVGRSPDKLPAHVTYGKDLQKLSNKDMVVIPDYHDAIKHRLDSVKVPHRVHFWFAYSSLDA